jgi:hypothetical protein
MGDDRTYVSWQSASGLLAQCNMKTLYLRNVPDDVSAALEELAAKESMSVSALAVRELKAAGADRAPCGP